MGSRKTYAERLEDLKQKQEQLRAQEKALLARQVVLEKKKRTKRYYEIGRRIEQTAGRPVEREELDKVLQTIRKCMTHQIQNTLPLK